MVFICLKVEGKGTTGALPKLLNLTCKCRARVIFWVVD